MAKRHTGGNTAKLSETVPFLAHITPLQKERIMKICACENKKITAFIRELLDKTIMVDQNSGDMPTFDLKAAEAEETELASAHKSWIKMLHGEHSKCYQDLLWLVHEWGLKPDYSNLTSIFVKLMEYVPVKTDHFSKSDSVIFRRDLQVSKELKALTLKIYTEYKRLSLNP